MTVITKSASQTQRAGELLARSLRGKALICLEGELGSGKTTFVQGLAKGLGIKERITSPTFVILKRFKIPNVQYLKFHPPKFSKGKFRRAGIQHLYHIDCYRVKNPKEILDLGLKEILEEKDALVVIEWAERIRKVLPKDRLVVKFEVVGEKKRKITLENF